METDQGRSVSRYASDAPEHRAHSAKMLALMLCALTGTLFIYQGQEIGMVNVPRSWPIEEYRDIEAVNFYRTMAAKTGGDRAELDRVMRGLQLLSRDNARLPMQWDGGRRHAGFTDGERGPWMRVHDAYREINVERQLREGDASVLGFWKRMIGLRKQHGDVLVHGAFEAFDMDNERTFVFGKKEAGGGRRRAAVALNFTGDEQEVELPAGYEGLVFQVGSHDDAGAAEQGAEGGRVRRLRPWEGRLYLAG